MVFWFCSVASALLVGLSKTGMPGVSILAIVLMAEAYPENAAYSVGAILPVLLAGDVFAVVRYRRHADWKRLLQLLPSVAVGMLVGAFFLCQFNDNSLRPVIGWLVLGMLAIEIARRRFQSGAMLQHWWFAAFSGFLAGFTTLVANAAMPVMSIYLVSQNFDKHRFVGTVAWFFLILNASKVPICLTIGNLKPEMLPTAVMLMPVAILGAFLGTYVLARIPQRLFDVLALVLAGAAAIKLLVT